jgi:hypothetical protein
VTTNIASQSSLFIYVTDSNTGEVKRIAIPTDVQVGRLDRPAELQLLGRFSTNLTPYDADANQTINLSINDTIAVINVVSASVSGSVIAELPSSPRAGQLLVIKDGTGTANVTNIVVTSSIGADIDDQDQLVLSDRNASVALFWTGEKWGTFSFGDHLFPTPIRTFVSSSADPLSASVNDYAPRGIEEADIIYIGATTPVSCSGLKGSGRVGRPITLFNTGSHDIVFLAQNSSSSVGNRLINRWSSTAVPVRVHESIQFISGTNGWVQIGGTVRYKQDFLRHPIRLIDGAGGAWTREIHGTNSTCSSDSSTTYWSVLGLKEADTITNFRVGVKRASASGTNGIRLTAYRVNLDKSGTPGAQSVTTLGTVDGDISTTDEILTLTCNEIVDTTKLYTISVRSSDDASSGSDLLHWADCLLVRLNA